MFPSFKTSSFPAPAERIRLRIKLILKSHMLPGKLLNELAVEFELLALRNVLRGVLEPNSTSILPAEFGMDGCVLVMNTHQGSSSSP